MSNMSDALDIFAGVMRRDTPMLSSLALVNKSTHASVMKAREVNLCERAIPFVADPSVQSWLYNEETVRQFARAALAPDPFRAYHTGLTNVIADQGFSAGSEVHGNVTARSLLLGRFTATTDLLYGADNYRVCLALNSEQLHAMQGQELLDVGCGDSLFPAEARAIFNIHVQGVDLHAQDDEDAKKRIFLQYVKNLVFEEFIAAVRGLEPPDGVGQENLRNLCLQRLHDTRCHYMKDSPERGDATHLQYADNRFSGCVSSWLFMYLTHEQALQALREMIRVTRSGGLIRICEGFELFNSGANMGLPQDLSGVQGIVEVSDVQELGTNRGGLRVFRVTKGGLISSITSLFGGKS